MGFLQSYLRLPRYQRIVLGLVGVALGWYGPSLMSYLFLRNSTEETSVKGWLFAIAMVTSLMWYQFWLVMSPVELDIAEIVNWYLFMQLKLNRMVGMYEGLKTVHYWLPLVIITTLVLSKASPFCRSTIDRISQVVYVVVIIYNSVLLIFLLFAGWKVVQLFLVTFPLVLLLHFGPSLSYVFSPHVLWIHTSICLLLYFLACQYIPSSDKRSHKSCGFWSSTGIGAAKRVFTTFMFPFFLTGLTYMLMERGCIPCSISPGFGPKTTPLKPQLVAHRGCSFDAPENSLAAFEMVSGIPGVMGLETDVSLSMEGIPFLLHDPHLIRTTDIKSKCPSHDPHANASLLFYHKGNCPLSKLNVGKSFTHTHYADLSHEQVTQFESQQLPTFGRFLEVAKRKDKAVIFDAYQPPVGHPFHESYLNRTLAHILSSGISLKKVWWLPPEQRKWVHHNYPEMVLTAKTQQTSFAEMKSEHIQKVNDDWTTPLRTLRLYQQSNLSINMFFVDSLFMFQYAWCVGVQSVTTSNCRQLSSIQSNIFSEICKKWHFESEISPPLLVGGLSVVSLEVISLICWEILKLIGYCPRTVKR